MAKDAGDTNTMTCSAQTGEHDLGPVPGLVTVFMNKRAVFGPIVAGFGDFTIGRVQSADQSLTIEDDSVSREHTDVTLVRDGAHVLDRGSRNGTFLGGARIEQRAFAPYPCFVRVGHTIIIAVSDCRPYAQLGVRVTPSDVLGPALQAAHRQIERAAKGGDCVLLTGASGTGKERGARAFHAATGRKGPFVAVNCATIPSGLAERLLFGAKKGAYSGADADAEGYVQAANGGTLFLDEVADLDPVVQPKLLRMLEEHEIMELGASRPRKIDLRVCVATLKDLGAEVAAKRFREDLYFRIGRPEVRLPLLCERLEEIPWLVEMELAAKEPTVRTSAVFVEECMTREWPGNLRELLLEVRQAARAARDDGRTSLLVKDLSPKAGVTLPPLGSESGKALRPSLRPSSPSSPPSSLKRAAQRDEAAGDALSAAKPPPVPDEAVIDALRRAKGNVLATARALGWHRNQVRRWLARRGLSAKSFDESGAPASTGEPIAEGDDSET